MSVISGHAIHLVREVYKLMHVENGETDHLQHDLYVDISYKFLLAWVFVSHTCTPISMNTFLNFHTIAR